MSHPSRPRTLSPAERRRRSFLIEQVTLLEDRQLLAPFVSLFPRQATLFGTATTVAPTTTQAVQVTDILTGTLQAAFPSAAPLTSVGLFAPSSDFGGDIVRIRSGPGGDFGKGVYAISRGAGSNAGAINRPGVIYRVDSATGKASVFFDLNTVVSKLPVPSTDASNSVGASTGLVNWYDISFDPEGYFDGRPSLFVSSVDRSDPNKNAIYRIAPDGTFLGAFATFSAGQAAGRFTSNPTAILVPPTEQQSFLRGLVAGSGSAGAIANQTFSAFFFDANAYRPGQNLSTLTTATLPFGISQTGLTFGPQTGLVSANIDYISPVFSTFTDFGTPNGGGLLGSTGFSGIQGLGGEFPINNGIFPLATDIGVDVVDRTPAISTNFRRFEDIGFDYYGYFSQGVTLTTTTGTAGGGAPGGGGSGGGTTAGNGAFFTFNNLAFAGSLFAADLGTGLSVALTPPGAPAGTPPTLIPVQGPGTASVTLNGPTVVPGGNLGGRIVRISPNGVVTNFAENFNTSGALGSQSFIDSSLSLTFSADGTTLYVADNDGIWQFKSVASLASSTSGSVIGLNDLRTLGIPYEGQNTAVAVVDTGVDGLTTNFRGRVTTGTSIVTNTPGNRDTAASVANSTTNGGTGGAGGTGGGGAGGAGGTTNGNTGGTSIGISFNGHGTLIAGVIAELVPQTTIVPVNVFAPFLAVGGSSAATGGGAGGGAGGGGNNTTSFSSNSNGLSTTQNIYDGLQYVATHPFVQDPVRPNRLVRVVATAMGFGSSETFVSEGDAYRRYPQEVIALKNQMSKLRKRGIAPIAAAGQFGAPFAAISSSLLGGGGGVGGGAGGGVGGGVGGGGGVGNNGLGFGNNNADNPNVGDVNGMALPAILNEVISVTGTIPFPFNTGPQGLPVSSPSMVNLGFVGIGFGPVLLFGNGAGIAGTGGTTTTGTGTTTTGAGNINQPSPINQLLAGNQPFPGTTGGANAGTGTGTGTGGGGGNNNNTNGLFAGIFITDRILAAANRSVTTDFAAPAVDVPTFRRRFAGDGGNSNALQEGGTSLAAGEVTGAYVLVQSALDYWSNLNKTGVTSDAYLTQPVGVNTLNFGPKAFRELKAYNNIDGINSILQWTAAPVSDPNDSLSESTPSQQLGSTAFPQYSRLSVSNAVAAIEGTVALQWLIKHNMLEVIDANHNGLITAQEVQTFVDTASASGLAEAGAMARLLGGTSRISAATTTDAGESPDQPDVLQRRFNFFDYVADGQLNGVVSIAQLKQEAHTLLPLPNSFSVVDRQRASVNGYLVDPSATRNFKALQHIQPSYQFVPKSAVAKYKGVSPAAFGVHRGETPSGLTFPVYELFSASRGQNRVNTATAAAKTTTPTPTSSNTPTTSSGHGGLTFNAPNTQVATTAVATPSPSQVPTLTTTPTTPTPVPTTTPTNLLTAIQALAASGIGQPSPASTSLKPASTTSGQAITPTATTPTTPAPAATTVLPTATPLAPGTVVTPVATTPATSASTTAATSVGSTTLQPSGGALVAQPRTKAAKTEKSKNVFVDAYTSIKKTFHL